MKTNNPAQSQDRLTLLHQLEKKLGYQFRDITLLSTALTHKSYHHEHPQLSSADNERLEFLGDAILSLCVSDCIFKQYENFSEGQLTQLRSALVNEKNLARMADDINIGESLLIGRGEELSGSRRKKTFLADALEAIIAAVYLDSDFTTAQNVIRDIIAPLLNNAALLLPYFDYKTALQEICQKKFKTVPIYMLKDLTGPEHARMFEVEVMIGGMIQETGRGSSKKEAEKQAAQKAWEILQDETGQ